MGYAEQCQAAEQAASDSKELRELKIKTKEAVNTMWRFIGAYKKENYVPISNALKSAEYHLKQLDYLFDK